MAKIKVVIETDETIKVKVCKQDEPGDGLVKLKCDMDKIGEGADDEDTN